jgi:transposase
MAYSLLRRPAQRTETEQRQLTQVQQADPLLATLVSHTETFAQMVRERAADRLDSWVERVLASPWRELKRFAQGLRQDDAVVKAALTLRYSNGPTEGHVNRLKLFKPRCMGGPSWTSYGNGCFMRPEVRASPLHELWARTN